MKKVEKYIIKKTIYSLDSLPDGITKDTIVYSCIQPTYGCITENGIACTFDPQGGYPFFEVPEDYLSKQFKKFIKRW